jgi:hypothetical protein
VAAGSPTEASRTGAKAKTRWMDSMMAAG